MLNRIVNDAYSVRKDTHTTQKRARAHTHTHTHTHINKRKGIYLYPLNLMIHRSSDLGLGTLSAFDSELGDKPPSSHKTPFTTAGELRST